MVHTFFLFCRINKGLRVKRLFQETFIFSCGRMRINNILNFPKGKINFKLSVFLS